MKQKTTKTEKKRKNDFLVDFCIVILLNILIFILVTWPNFLQKYEEFTITKEVCGEEKGEVLLGIKDWESAENLTSFRILDNQFIESFFSRKLCVDLINQPTPDNCWIDLDFGFLDGADLTCRFDVICEKSDVVYSLNEGVTQDFQNIQFSMPRFNENLIFYNKTEQRMYNENEFFIAIVEYGNGKVSCSQAEVNELETDYLIAYSCSYEDGRNCTPVYEKIQKQNLTVEWLNENAGVLWCDLNKVQDKKNYDYYDEELGNCVYLEGISNHFNKWKLGNYTISVNS